ncbi:MBL fold metallo-hydrolase [Marivivens donghaensis]|uniref:MBL fold metallo-hydrolase n=1 Tax=Marivivens donghaensis TaxID=1699413 RepID=A0ABX0VY75_9RHOB|nr:MBL fold metallo-hydrolase [Marivivens donghaensis]NIY72769.1 MBL fold metallo-hydrolase [Marivivens donghaensis]
MRQVITDDIVLVRADNPSPMTFTGTNSYVVGTESVVVIDPGPPSDAHLNALLAEIAGRLVDGIIVTHAHLDHSPLARPLADKTGAKVYAFGRAEAGRSDMMTDLAARGLVRGGEGVDHDFDPDVIVSDGDTVLGMTVHHTPGHMGNHICLQRGEVMFTADHIMGWATSMVSPPDGDLSDFMASCRKMLTIPSTRYLPGHGDPVTEPHDRVRWLIAHRLEREAQIMDALLDGPADADTLTRRIYADVQESLWPAAKRNVIAHLVDLTKQNRVSPDGELTPDAKFFRL